MADCVSVDDEVVEKLLELSGDVETSDESKAEFSLKSVADVLYRQQQQQQHVDSVDNDAADSPRVPNDLQPTLPTATAMMSSTADTHDQSEMSVPYLSSKQLSFTSMSSAEEACSTVSDVGDAVDKCVPCNAERTLVDNLSGNSEHLPNAFLSTSSSGAPYFCIPTVPVISPSVVCAQKVTGHDDVVRQNIYCSSPAVSPVVAQIVSSLACSSTSLPSRSPPSHSHTALPPMTSLSSQPVLYSDCSHMLQQSIHSQAGNRTIMSTSEAVSRVCELLRAQCKVLVLMRGCPGSGKSTMARYVPVSCWLFYK